MNGTSTIITQVEVRNLGHVIMKMMCLVDTDTQPTEIGTNASNSSQQLQQQRQ